jgi:predicted GNAT family N-acyltransferase
MITSAFIPGTEDLTEPFAVRKAVFVKEQQVSEEEEFDEYDASALHLIIYIDEQTAATGRIWHDGKNFRIGRLAVLKQFRGQQIGDLALRLLLYKAFSSGADVIEISAQTYIMPLYSKFGFKEYGEEYMEAGIPHMAMKVTKDEVIYPSACQGQH